MKDKDWRWKLRLLLYVQLMPSYVMNYARRKILFTITASLLQHL